jgi:HEAT repeat protein
MRASPKLLRQVINEQRTHDVLNGAANNLILTAQKNKGFLKQLVRSANAKTNPDFNSRELAIFALNKLALDGSATALRGLLAAVDEPSFNLRFTVVTMLYVFAKKGNKTVFFGLKKATNDKESHIRLSALKALVFFAKRKDPRVFEIAYKFVAAKSHDEHEAALTIINTLASKKYKPAMDVLGKYKGFKRETRPRKRTGEELIDF